MISKERKIIDSLENRKLVILFVLVTILGLAIRISLFNFRSNDFINFLNPWYIEIKKLGGLNALRRQVGNYGITYQFLIALFTYLPGKSLYWYKGLSVFFDFVLALSGGLLAQRVSKKSRNSIFIFTYSMLLILPTIFFNSSLWGQCDSIYTSFIILSLLQLSRRKNISSFIFLGIAMAFKFQTIFILPLFFLVYLLRKDFSISYFLISLFSFYVCCLPGIIMGRGLLAPIKIYLSQTANQPGLSFGYPNFIALFAKAAGKNFAWYQMLHRSAILLTFTILCIGLVYILSQKTNIKSYDILIYAAWTTWTFVMFMPDMHDRYGYLAEIFLIILSIIRTRYALNATVSIINSILMYSVFLFGLSVDWTVVSYIEILNYFIFTLLVFNEKTIDNCFRKLLGNR